MKKKNRIGRPMLGRQLALRKSLRGTATDCLGLINGIQLQKRLNSSINITGRDGYCTPEDAPVMNFLKDSSILPQLVEPTIQHCQQLLDNLERAKTPAEKHDLLDSTSNVLCLLLDPCEMVRQVHPDVSYKKAAYEAFARGNEFMCHTNSRRDLYDHLVDLASTESIAQLEPEVIKNVKQLKFDMESNGIHLSDKQRHEITKMNMEAEHLASQYISELGRKNPYGVLRNLLMCRANLAKELGFECYADQKLRGTMLDSREKVWQFLCSVQHKYRPNAIKEMERMQKFLGEHRRTAGKLRDVDRSNLSVRIKAEYEEDGIERYFSVGNCIRGIQCICSEVFDVTLLEVPFHEDEKLHCDAKKFHVYDTDKSFLGVIILDMFARESKHCQAGHITVQLGCKPHQEALKSVGLELPERQYPVVVLTCNAGGARKRAGRKPDGRIDEESTLMSPNEVTTCFHEFGHAMHTIFGQTKVQNLAGTRGSIDYVECFSQFFEQFLTSHDFLKLWAKEIGTGHPIPRALVQRRNEVDQMFQHLDTLDQVCLASIDMCLHGPLPYTVYFPHEGTMGKRTVGTLQEYGRGLHNLSNLIMDVWRPISPIEPTEKGVLRSLSLEHLTSYPAGYYGYLYSLAFAKRIWNKNFAANPLNKEEGRRLRTEVMSFGAACDPRQVMASYLGENIDDIETWV